MSNYSRYSITSKLELVRKDQELNEIKAQMKSVQDMLVAIGLLPTNLATSTSILSRPHKKQQKYNKSMNKYPQVRKTGVDAVHRSSPQMV
jgi:hypothetical protein